MPICNSTEVEYSYKVTHLVHVLDFLTHELQTMNTEQIQAIGDITDRIAEQVKTLVSLQITADTTHADPIKNR